MYSRENEDTKQLQVVSDEKFECILEHIFGIKIPQESTETTTVSFSETDLNAGNGSASKESSGC